MGGKCTIAGCSCYVSFFNQDGSPHRNPDGSFIHKEDEWWYIFTPREQEDILKKYGRVDY